MSWLRGAYVLSLFSVAALVAQIANIITVDESLDTDPPVKNSKLPALKNNEDSEVFVFLQITDLHVSQFADAERYEQLKEFCKINLKAINPKLVIASGDLTDAIDYDRIKVRQFEKEWKMYKDFYSLCKKESGVSDWFDLRGNHDNFNVDGFNSSTNYYSKFAVQRGRGFPGSYMKVIQATNSSKYAFVAVDATLHIGPKRILNFVGELDEDRIAKLKKFRRAIAMDSKIKGSIWFGHYPTSSIFSSDPGIRQVAADSIAYLCGHFHNFGGLVPQMYSRHHSNLLELELADWKANRMYRVLVLDNGLFSFADVKHRSWPVVVVTNPKPVITVQPSKEPIALMLSSNHIRMLIFSPSPITLCEFKINQGLWQQCELTGKTRPLYTAHWDPELYSKGLHMMDVRARDASGAESLTRVEFSLDNTRSSFPILARIALMMDITTLFQVLFFVAVTLCIVPYCAIRFCQMKILQRQMPMHRFRNRIAYIWIRKLWIFANIDGLFYPVAIYTVYLTFGPWFAGNLIDGRIGVVFAWGTIFDGKFLTGTFSYFYGFTHVVLFNGMLIIILALTADFSFQEKVIKKRAVVAKWRKYLKQAPFCFFFIMHVITFYPFWVSYGTLALVVSPMSTWAMILACILWKRATDLSEEDFLDVSKIWA